MQRRTFITLVGGAIATAWPFVARAQQAGRMRRIGVLTGVAVDDPEGQARTAAFLQGLQQLGWTVGRNLQIEHRWAAGSPGDLHKYAAELVALAPEVIFATGGTSLGSLLQVTRMVPIVFAIVPDPVGSGFVNSLARPGGNATGFMQFEYTLSAKWPELLKEIAPSVIRAAVLWDPAIPPGIGQFAVIQAVAPSVGVGRDPGQRARCDRDRARRSRIRTFAKWRPDRDCERVGGGSSRSDRHACGQAQTARGLLPKPICHWRRPDLLWKRLGRPVPTRGGLRRSHP